jgi:hypothetical protein
MQEEKPNILRISHNTMAFMGLRHEEFSEDGVIRLSPMARSESKA